MSSTVAYKDSTASDYLEAIRKHIQSNDNKNTSAENFTPTFIKPVTSKISLANAFTHTQKTLGDYDVVDNTGKLVAYLPFDLDPLDASNDNHGTWTGTETYVDGPEINEDKHRKAADFDGASYLTLANESNFDREHNQPFSICGWIKTTTSATMMIWAKDNTAGSVDNGFWIYWNDSVGQIIFGLDTGSGGSQTFFQMGFTIAITDGLWRHLCCTFSGNSNRNGMKMYVDGVLVATGAAGAISESILNNVPLVIGADSDGSLPFTGQMSQVQFWNVELVQADVTDIVSGKQINKDTAATNPGIISLTDVK